MKRPLILLSALAALVFLIAGCGSDPTPATVTETVTEIVEVTPTPPPATGARELNLLAGAGEGTVLLNAFLARNITVRVGDTVTWGLGHPGEPHTVTFLAGTPRPPDVVPIEGRNPTDVQLNPAVAFPTRAPGAPRWRAMTAPPWSPRD
ncbi:MAG: hypothetical protein O3A93_05885 [Chloroflexi bacterium]|nr:hypothetical protein [Chloroflexota bacterium]